MNAPERAKDFIPFDNSYARLPDRFFARQAPTPVAAPRLLKLNASLAEELGLDPETLAAPEGVAALAGNRTPEGAEPLAMAYAGHQFGGWVPQLGDGRALLLGEVIDRDGRRRDIQLKGSGPTPFSRMGDGRAAVGPVLREYLVSEAMAALGVPTTRALAAVATGEAVMRERPLPGAVLTRVASGHVRVGTFQFFTARRDVEAVRLLADHVIARRYPELAEAERPYLALLEAVIAAQAALVAKWLSFGFIHGVMNTDNMSVFGETIDYGPCAFMDAYRSEQVYSSIDHHGRYAYANQPPIAQWNLACLAQCLLPLIADDEQAAIADAQRAVNAFPETFEAAWLAAMRAKLGLASEQEGDIELARELLRVMEANKADFTLTFRALADLAGPEADNSGRALFEAPEAFDAWASGWRARLAQEPTGAAERAEAMRRANPLYIPRNHLVEEALSAAEAGDLAPFERLHQVLSSPFQRQDDASDDVWRYQAPPKPEERVLATFCGT